MDIMDRMYKLMEMAKSLGIEITDFNMERSFGRACGYMEQGIVPTAPITEINIKARMIDFEPMVKKEIELVVNKEQEIIHIGNYETHKE